MIDFKLISSDSHMAEHPKAWERVQHEYGDRAPHIVEDPPELGKGLWIIVDGIPPVRAAYYCLGLVVDKPAGITNVSVQMDSEEYRRTIQEFNETFRYEDFPGGWEPAAYLQNMDMDGVEAALLFSSPTRYNYTQTDARFQRAILRSYNEWLLDFASYAPKRLFPVPLISVLDVELAVADLYEYAKAGVKTVQIPTQIIGSGYFEPVYEPLWAAAEDTGLVLNVHSNSSQNQKRVHVEGPRQQDPRAQIIGGSQQAPALEAISNLLLSGVFDRHPKLKLACTEFKCHWVAGLLQRLDYTLARGSLYDPERNLYKRLPSEYFRDNIVFSFEDDRAGVLTTPMYGEDNFMFGTDYPHHVTTWPHSEEVIQENCEGFPPSLMRKLGRDNAIRIYDLDL
jgi:predicted TIM-barrel fold metal-dependent hydrolase